MYSYGQSEPALEMKCLVSISLWCSLLLVLLAQNFRETSANQKKVVCYYSSWAVYRPGRGKFDVENIDPHLCTHVIYAFIGVNWDATIRVMDPHNDLEENYGNGGFKRFNAMRNVNPNLKTLVAIGGWNEGSAVFSEVTRTSSVRATFVNNLYNFVKQHGFSGLDLDWEYPGQRGGAPEDKANFVSLIKELRAKFAPEGLLLTAAVSASIASAGVSYNIPEIANNLDFVNLMTYDFHGSWESKTGINSPLYPASIDTDLTINADATVRHWIQQGAPADKLILGFPSFGRSFTLQNSNSPGLGAVATGPGVAGPYTQEVGFLGYNELCEKAYPGGWSLNWAAQQKVPFAFLGNQWVGFENTESVRIKAEYAIQHGLGGVLVWGVETDDFLDVCGKGKFPLINTVKNTLNAMKVSNDVNRIPNGPYRLSTVNWFGSATSSSGEPTTSSQIPSSTTRAPTTTTRAPTTTTRATTTTTRAPTTTRVTSTTTTEKPSSSIFTCKSEGYFREPANCSVYYYCQATSSGLRRLDFNCPAPLYYDASAHICDWAYKVSC